MDSTKHFRKALRGSNGGDEPLSEIAVDALRQLNKGGTYDVNEFDPEAMRELQERRYTRGYRGERIGISPEGELHLKRLKERGELEQSVRPFAGLVGQSSVAAAPLDEVQRVHAALDDAGVPRTFYGSPLTADARIRVLVDALVVNTRMALKARFARTAGFEDAP